MGGGLFHLPFTYSPRRLGHVVLWFVCLTCDQPVAEIHSCGCVVESVLSFNGPSEQTKEGYITLLISLHFHYPLRIGPSWADLLVRPQRRRGIPFSTPVGT